MRCALRGGDMRNRVLYAWLALAVFGGQKVAAQQDACVGPKPPQSLLCTVEVNPHITVRVDVVRLDPHSMGFTLGTRIGS